MALFFGRNKVCPTTNARCVGRSWYIATCCFTRNETKRNETTTNRRYNFIALESIKYYVFRDRANCLELVRWQELGDALDESSARATRYERKIRFSRNRLWLLGATFISMFIDESIGQWRTNIERACTVRNASARVSQFRWLLNGKKYARKYKTRSFANLQTIGVSTGSSRLSKISSTESSNYDRFSRKVAQPPTRMPSIAYSFYPFFSFFFLLSRVQLKRVT